MGCIPSILAENNGPTSVVKSFNSAPLTGTNCWKLKEVIIGKDGDLIQEYDDQLNQGDDLVRIEKIEENGYSVFLEYVRYDWQ